MEMVNETVADFYLSRMLNTGNSIKSLVNAMNVSCRPRNQVPAVASLSCDSCSVSRE
jgi:hypothetical protein